MRYKNRFLVADVHCDRTNALYLKDKLVITSSSKGKPSSKPEEEGLGPGRGVPLVATALEEVVHSCFGVCNSGAILSSMQVRCYDKIWSAGGGDDGDEDDGLAKCLRCVVRCDREHYRDVRAALSLITSLAGVRVAITVVKVKGSQRTLADEAKAEST